PSLAEIAVEDAVEAGFAQIKAGLAEPQQITLTLTGDSWKLNPQSVNRFIDFDQVLAHPERSLGVAEVDKLLVLVAELHKRSCLWFCLWRRLVPKRRDEGGRTAENRLPSAMRIGRRDDVVHQTSSFE